MSKKRSHDHKSQQREIKLGTFLFQQSYLGKHADLSEVINSGKIRETHAHVVFNARDSDHVPIMINCLKGCAQRTDGDEKDHLECVKILLSTGFIDLNLRDEQGLMALHWGVLLNKLEIFHALMAYGAQKGVYGVDDVRAVLHLALEKCAEKFVVLLLETYKQHEQFQEILEGKDDHGRTPLYQSVLTRSKVNFETLLSFGADPNGGVGIPRKSVVVHLVESNEVELLQILLKYPVRLNPNGDGTFNAIHMASKMADSKCLELLYDACADGGVGLECVDENGVTPLMYAVQCGSIRNVEFLLSANVSSSTLDNDGRSALHYTARNTHTSCVGLLLQHNPDLFSPPTHSHPHHEHKTALQMAVIANNVLIVRRMLGYGADKDEVDAMGRTLIHYTTEYSALECFHMLIAEHGSSVNIPDTHNVYPIHYAVRLNEKDQQRAKIEYLRALLEVPDIELDVYDGAGLHPIHWAVSMGFVEAIKELLKKDVSPNTITKEERFSPLHLACQSSQMKSINLLLHQPTIDTDQVDGRDGYTPLMVACGLPNPHFCELLLKRGANPNHVAFDHKTPGHVASGNEVTVDCLRFLSLHKDACLDLRGLNGETPLQVACVNPNEACMKFLLKKRCDVNSSQKNGLTALHLVVCHKDAHRAQLLLQNNAKCNSILYGEEVLTALDIALENVDYKCIKLLQRYGAKTSHCIRHNAATIIQLTWKRYTERNIRGNYGNGIHSNGNYGSTPMLYDDWMERDIEENPDESDERFGLCKFPPIHNGGGRSVGNANALLGTHGYTVMSEKEFQESISFGRSEVAKMREMMKMTEQMLVNVNCVNEGCDVLLESDTYKTMKRVNRSYIEETYRHTNQQLKDHQLKDHQPKDQPR